MQKKIIFAKYQGRESSDSIYMNPPAYIYPKKSDPALELCIVCGWNFNVGGSNSKVFR
jgi:hypothetical protein